MEARLEFDRVPPASTRPGEHPVLARARAMETLADPMPSLPVWALAAVVPAELFVAAILAQRWPEHGFHVMLGATASVVFVVVLHFHARCRQLRQRIDALQDIVRDLDERR